MRRSLRKTFRECRWSIRGALPKRKCDVAQQQRKQGDAAMANVDIPEHSQQPGKPMLERD